MSSIETHNLAFEFQSSMTRYRFFIERTLNEKSDQRSFKNMDSEASGRLKETRMTKIILEE